MPEVAVKDLPERYRAMAVKTKQAVESGQYDVGIDLGNQILAEYPGCVSVRRLHHAAQLEAKPAKARLWGKLTATFQSIKKDRSEPASSPSGLAAADKILRSDPRSRAGLIQLADSAAQHDMPETELFARQCLVECEPGNRDAGLAWAEALLRQKRFAEATSAIQAVLKSHPQDGQALALLRRIAVGDTMGRGNWESGDSFRDKLRQ